jgi:cyclic pyranopterin phosphate synthase
MGGNLQNAIDGIKAAVKSGIYPVKLNMLLLKNINENEINDMIKFATETGTILQMIELEPINLSIEYYERYHISLDKIANKLESLAQQTKVREFMQKRRLYLLPKVKVELIRPIENTEFCANCTRIRVTSDGKVKPCLMKKNDLIDILTPMRNGADYKELREIFVNAVKKREPYYKKTQKVKNLP